MRETLPKRRGRYSKANEAEVMPAIRTAIDARSTYGYCRIAVVANPDRAAQGLPLLNHKRVYRIMTQNGMLLRRHSGKRSKRPHESKVVTLQSNTR